MIKVTDVRLPFQSHVFVSHVLQTGDLAAGDYVTTLERLVAAYSGAKHAVAMNSGTAALQLAVETTVDPGSRVAIPAMTFAATANAVYAAGCIPVVVDVGDDRMLDYNLVPDNIDAVLPVDLYGAKAPSTDVWPVIEDACQAVGHPVNHGAISLYGSKTVAAGEGGVFVTNDEEAADYVRVASNQGMERKYEHVMVGHNYRLSNLAAAVAVPQLTQLPTTIAQRRANAARLWELLSDLPVGLPTLFDHNYHQFVITTPNRDAVAEYLGWRGVETGVHYPVSLSELEWVESGDCPKGEKLAREVLSLPVHEHLTENEILYVGQTVVDAVRKCVLV